MRPELEQRLKDEFEFLRNDSYSFSTYGFEVLDGWFNLIYSMCKEIQTTGADFVPVQIKQKYGYLRVYYKATDARIPEIVERYEELSGTVCEQCGKTGVYRHRHMMVMCDECFNQIEK